MEFTFYTIVLTVAVICLILLLTFVGLSFKKTKLMNFPPSKNTCPDYWTADYTDPQKPVCKIDMKNIGTIKTVRNPTNGIETLMMTNNPNDTDKEKAYTPGYNADTYTVDFSDTAWPALFSSSGQCSLKKWANKYEISWDGVSNFNNCK